MPIPVRANQPPTSTAPKVTAGRTFPANTWVLLPDEEWAGQVGEAIRQDPLFTWVDIKLAAALLAAVNGGSGAVILEAAAAERMKHLEAEVARLEAEAQAREQLHAGVVAQLQAVVAAKEKERADAEDYIGVLERER